MAFVQHNGQATSSRLFMTKPLNRRQMSLRDQIAERIKEDGPIGLYVHIPYCRQRCRYCNFAIVPIGPSAAAIPMMENTTDEAIALEGFRRMDHNYLQALLRELEYLRKQPKTDTKILLQSIYFGGGTPSLAPIETIQAILQALLHDVDSSPFQLALEAEVTMEVDPGTFTLSQLLSLKEMGFNRISLGVQSMEDSLLTSMGRFHRQNDILEAISMLDQVFGPKPNYSIDLISGLPGLSRTKWMETLQWVTQLHPAPTHLSLYDLQIEQGTVFGRWYDEDDQGEKDNTVKDAFSRLRDEIPSKQQQSSVVFPLPSEDDCAFMYKFADGYLTAKGYEHYEISSYAYCGNNSSTTATNNPPSEYRSRHNQIYWNAHGQWYALGLGATSFINQTLTARPRLLADYLAWTEDLSTIKESETLVPDEDFLAEVVMKRLRTSDGLDIGWVQQTFGHDSKNAILRGAQLGLELGLVHRSEQEILSLVRPAGFLYSNNLISSIFVELEQHDDD